MLSRRPSTLPVQLKDVAVPLWHCPVVALRHCLALRRGFALRCLKFSPREKATGVFSRSNSATRRHVVRSRKQRQLYVLPAAARLICSHMSTRSYGSVLLPVSDYAPTEGTEGRSCSVPFFRSTPLWIWLMVFSFRAIHQLTRAQVPAPNFCQLQNTQRTSRSCRPHSRPPPRTRRGARRTLSRILHVLRFCTS